MISVFEEDKNITKCSKNDLVCCKNNWFVLGPGGSYDNEVSIQSDHPNYCGIFAEGSCQRRQSCGNIGTLPAEMFWGSDFWLETRVIIKISTHS